MKDIRVKIEPGKPRKIASYTSIGVFIGLVILTIVTTAQGCDISQKKTMEKDLRIAMDHHQSTSTRREAASRLKEKDQQKLRRFLTDQLPGDWDLKTLDAIQILGIVGNDETIARLRRLESEADEVPKILVNIAEAIDEIRSRKNLYTYFL